MLIKITPKESRGDSEEKATNLFKLVAFSLFIFNNLFLILFFTYILTYLDNLYKKNKKSREVIHNGTSTQEEIEKYNTINLITLDYFVTLTRIPSYSQQKK